MNKFNANKLMHSKWTAVKPNNKEKHFVVVKCLRDDNAKVISCIIEAVYSKKQYTKTPEQLQDTANWHIGWC